MVTRIVVPGRWVWPYIPRYTCFAKECQETGVHVNTLTCGCSYVLCQNHKDATVFKPTRGHPEHWRWK